MATKLKPPTKILKEAEEFIGITHQWLNPDYVSGKYLESLGGKKILERRMREAAWQHVLRRDYASHVGSHRVGPGVLSAETMMVIHQGNLANDAMLHTRDAIGESVISELENHDNQSFDDPQAIETYAEGISEAFNEMITKAAELGEKGQLQTRDEFKVFMKEQTQSLKETLKKKEQELVDTIATNKGLDENAKKELAASLQANLKLREGLLDKQRDFLTDLHANSRSKEFMSQPFNKRAKFYNTSDTSGVGKMTNGPDTQTLTKLKHGVTYKVHGIKTTVGLDEKGNFQVKIRHGRFASRGDILNAWAEAMEQARSYGIGETPSNPFTIKIENMPGTWRYLTDQLGFGSRYHTFADQLAEVAAKKGIYVDISYPEREHSVCERLNQTERQRLPEVEKIRFEPNPMRQSELQGIREKAQKNVRAANFMGKKLDSMTQRQQTSPDATTEDSSSDAKQETSRIRIGSNRGSTGAS